MFSLGCSNNINVPESIITTTNGIVQIDSRNSSTGGVISGGIAGNHSYTFVTNYNIPDVTASETPLTVIEGNNASLNSGVWEKDISGNSWNSYVKSVESFDSSGVWSITWDIIADSGTIRQMGGIDNDPSANSSYSSIDHAIYQVNGYFYNYVYESGSSKQVTNLDTVNRYVDPGDRFGIQVTGGYIMYFILKGTVIFPMFYSTVRTINPNMYFKAAMNRGNTSSGHSKVGGVWVHTSTKLATKQHTINGSANELISTEDIEFLGRIGMNVQSGSTYSNIYYERDSSGSFVDSSGDTYDLDMTHGYTATANQDVQLIQHS